MSTSTATANDLSDAEWEEVARLFHEKFVTFGGLWKSMLARSSKTTTTAAATIASPPPLPPIENENFDKKPSPRLSDLASSESSLEGDDDGVDVLLDSPRRTPYIASSRATSPEHRRHDESVDQRHSLDDDSESPSFVVGADQESYEDDGYEAPDNSGRDDERGERPSGSEVGDGAGGAFILERRDHDDDVDVDTTADEDLHLRLEQLQIGGEQQESGSIGPISDGGDDANDNSPERFDDDSPGRHDLLGGTESPRSSNHSTAEESSLVPLNTSADTSSSDASSGESTVVCFDHLDFDDDDDDKPANTSPRDETTTKKASTSFNVEADPFACVTSPLSCGRTRVQLAPSSSCRDEAPASEEVQSSSDSPRLLLALATPNVTIRSKRRRRHQQLRAECDCDVEDGLELAEEGRRSSFSTPRDGVDSTSSASSASWLMGSRSSSALPSVQDGDDWASNLICRPCASSTGDDVASKTGSIASNSDVKAETSTLGPRDVGALDHSGFNESTAREQPSEDGQTSAGSVSAVQLGSHHEHLKVNSNVDWSETSQNFEESSCPSDEVGETSRPLIPQVVSTSRSVDTIMSPMNDSAWAANSTVIASSSSTSSPSVQALINRAMAKLVPTSILRSTKETVLSPLASMTPFPRPGSKPAAHAMSSGTPSSSIGARSNGSSLKILPRPPSDTPVLAEGLERQSLEESDDDIPTMRSQSKSKIISRHVMLDDSDESGSEASDLSKVAAESRSEAADDSSQRSADATANLDAGSINELATTMGGIRIEASRLSEDGLSSDELSDSQAGTAKALPPAHSMQSKQLSTRSLGSTSNESGESKPRHGRKGRSLAIDSEAVDMASPAASMACKSPRIIELLDTSSESDGSKEDAAPKKLNRLERSTLAAKAKPSTEVIDLLSSSSDSEEEEEFDIESEYSGGSSRSRDECSSPSSDDETREVVPHKQSLSSTKRAFLRQRESLAQQLFQQYDRRVFKGTLGGACTLKWSKRLTTTAGLTQMPKHSKTATVILSSKLLDRESRLRLTLMHELCHAAAWIIDGCTKPPHGEVFRKWGARAERLIPGMTVSTTHSYEIEYKFSWKCQNSDCGKVYGRTRRTIDVKRHRCGVCQGQLVEMVKQGPAKPKAPPSEYQRFVQEHSASVRQELEKVLRPSGLTENLPASSGTKKVSQSDVMKECARLWQARKATSSSTPGRENHHATDLLEESESEL